ncbi:Serine/threonine protein kinase, variant 1 [Phytophthora palmivora]|uniref:Serine/threonine protein kinase, variant 1 n=1 Tax=Phytophthora palmivora TaxID=4796 RepID=A0A2P4Y6B7_9STRA|nr:Serine/threonine protein kinase, variant 1 [Phytophthora palmivora]
MAEHRKKNRHVSKPAAARETSPPASTGSSVSSTSHRRDLLDGSIEEVSRKTLMERFRKRGRVESANYEQRTRTNHEERDRAVANTTLQSNSSSFASTTPMVFRTGRAPHHGTFLVHKSNITRPQSAPNLTEQVSDDEVITRIFPDICPRELRIAEVKSWECPWMDQEFTVSESETVLTLPHNGELLSRTETEQASTAESSRTSVDASLPAPIPVSNNGFHRNKIDTVDTTAKELDTEISSLTNQLSLEDKPSQPLSPPKNSNYPASAGTPPPVAIPQRSAPQWKTVESAKKTPGSRVGKRPQLRLKLEDMPTPQQAEERAQRAATRLIAKRDAMEAAAIAAAAASGSNTPANGPSAAQQVMMKLNFSSGSESDPHSPSGTVHWLFWMLETIF